MVPKASSPRSALARSPSTLSSSQSVVVAREGVRSSIGPVFEAIAGSAGETRVKRGWMRPAAGILSGYPVLPIEIANRLGGSK